MGRTCELNIFIKSWVHFVLDLWDSTLSLTKKPSLSHAYIQFIIHNGVLNPKGISSFADTD